MQLCKSCGARKRLSILMDHRMDEWMDCVKEAKKDDKKGL